jgi:glycosyltransferase involved in cell wall biosynthesis
LTSEPPKVALLVEGYPGQRDVAELARLAAAGERPRIHYVELARALDAPVIDAAYMRTSATAVSRRLVPAVGMPASEVVEAFLRRGRYDTVCAWSDRVGLPLALLHKMARSGRQVVLVSQWLSRPKKARLVTRLGVDSHLRAVVNSSTYQIDYARDALGIAAEKLHVAYRPVDDRFWTPAPQSGENVVSAVGWEARDYPTLLEAVEGLDVEVAIAVGMIGMEANGAQASSTGTGYDDHARLSVLAPWKGTYGYALQESWLQRIAREGAPPNVTIAYQLGAPELRDLYRRSRFVVVPLYDVDSNCGVTTVTEAMAMGRAVIVTRIRGQHDVITDGQEGMYVPPGDPGALRSAIGHLVAHPEEAERMGRAGRALVERRHTMDAYVAQLRAIVESAGAGPNDGSGRDGR